MSGEHDNYNNHSVKRVSIVLTLRAITTPGVVDDKRRLALRLYVRRLIERAKAEKKSLRKLGNELGVSGSWLTQIATPETYGEKNIGDDFLQLLADKLHGGSVYPNRSKAIELAAAAIGIPPKDAERLAPRALQASSDPEVLWWFDQIRSAHERKKKGIEPSIGREITDEDIGD
jgi:transcriptional regulator with XRE-family HTH domain